MKLATVARLVSAVKAKSGFAKARLAEIRNQKQAMLEDAARLDAEALELLHNPGKDAIDFVTAGRRQNVLEKRAAARRVNAAALDPEIAVCREALKSALLQELAWRRIERKLTADLQMRRLSQEEERREAIVLQSAGRAGRR